MNPMNIFTVPCLVALVSLIPNNIRAQGTYQVVPTTATFADGNTNSWFPYIYNKTRVQQIIDGDRFCTKSAILFQFAYRMDGTISKSYASRSISNLTVTMGHTKKSAATMSDTFNTNRTGTMTQIFSGTYNLPAQKPPTSGPAPFNIPYKFKAPFAFDIQKGNLLIEFVVPGSATLKSEYPLDGFISAALVTYNGKPGLFSNKSSSNLYIQSTATLKPGGSIDLINRSLTSAFPTVHVYGFSSTKYGPLSLPFDLAPLGAPGNMLYNSLDLMLVSSVTQSGSVWQGTSKLPIPNSSVFGGAGIFATNICLELTANKLGLVFGRGLAITIGGGKGIGLNLIYSQSSTSAKGNFFIRNNTGGPVTQLQGAFK